MNVEGCIDDFEVLVHTTSESSASLFALVHTITSKSSLPVCLTLLIDINCYVPSPSSLIKPVSLMYIT